MRAVLTTPMGMAQDAIMSQLLWLPWVRQVVAQRRQQEQAATVPSDDDSGARAGAGFGAKRRRVTVTEQELGEESVQKK